MSKPTQMLGMQVIRKIINLLQAIEHILEATLSLGGPGNRRWYHAPISILSTELWLRLHERWYGFNHVSKI